VKNQYLVINSVIFGVILGASGATWLTPASSTLTPTSPAEISGENTDEITGEITDARSDSPAPDREPRQIRTSAAPLTAVTTAKIPNLKPKVIRRILTVHKNDTLNGLLTGVGVTSKNAYRAITALSKKFKPRDLKIGQTLELTLKPVKTGKPVKAGKSKSKRATYTISRLSIDTDVEKTALIEQRPDGAYTAKINRRKLVSEDARREGTIDSSLYLAGRQAQVPSPILAKLIHIFSFDVDFQRDIQSGDRFDVMYEELSDEHGKKLGAGKILIAEMTLSGKTIRLFNYKSAKGDTDYYNAKGQSARKSLTLTPIDGARISSGYGRRRHPILGYTKMHRGVDFAAARGTPIYAGGRGVIEVAGRNGAYGRYIRIRHNSTYKTAYAHMKGFARGIRKGRRVKQGQVIGYVGTTGRSTGPHLHYEILKNGRQMNPRRLNLPSGRKLKGTELKRFQAARTHLDKRYAAVPSATQVAANPAPAPARK
jgi:murein DD-endopeptidase MepM/ murein hydrolase activator NlpD